jgi:tRNA pseudouridine38-40 synthase
LSRSFKLTIAYDGTDFAGWQIQPGQKTIQQALQNAIASVCKEQAQVIGSGRTDAGVHALAQVASCTLQNWRASARDLSRAMNTQLPDTIVVRDAVDAADGFHAIRDAISKRYRFQFQIGGTRDAFEYRYRWHIHGSLDINAMREAASCFLGRHDFASFQAAGGVIKKTTTREIRACQLIEQAASASGAMMICVEVEADGFLYNMVRNIVGTLVEVGRGKHPPHWVTDVINARDRGVAGPTAPPHGLFLVRVDYPRGI